MNINIENFEILRNNVIKTHQNFFNSLFLPTSENTKKIFIYGAGKYGKIILNLLKNNGIEPTGFIDNFLPETEIEKIKVYKQAEIQDKEALIIVSSLFNAQNIFQALSLDGFSNPLHFLALLIYKNESLEETTFLNESLQEYVLDIVDNKNEYAKTLTLFDDEMSKIFFHYLSDLRLDYNYKKNIDNFTTSTLYFPEDLFELKNDEIFVDGGGFIGDTTLSFIQKVKGEYEKIYIFEPCKESYDKSIENLKPFEKIQFFQKGISNKNEKLCFNTNINKYGCHISGNGNEIIETIKIDSEIKESVSLIKFDIEGCEKQGLLGAADLIKKYSPKLAICAYHRPRDLWELPQIIKNINPDYRIYVRLYGYNLEAVIYAIK